MGAEGAPSSIVFSVVSFFLKGVEGNLLEAIMRGYGNYQERTEGSRKASGRGDQEWFYLDALLEKDLLWAEVEGYGGVLKEEFVGTSTLITAAVHEMSVSKKGYVKLLHSFATEAQKARYEFQATSRESGGQKEKVEEWQLKVQLLTEAAEKGADLQKRMSDKEIELASTNSALD